MARKDDILVAFLSDKNFCIKYNIPENCYSNLRLARNSDIPVVKVLADIIDGNDAANLNPLYMQIINYLNDTL
jgi:hypothetical protein